MSQAEMFGMEKPEAKTMIRKVYRPDSSHLEERMESCTCSCGEKMETTVSALRGAAKWMENI
jgi:hypothetical protein